MLTPKKVFIWLILSRFCVIISENAGNASFNFVHWSAVNELSVVTAVLVLLQSTVFPYISLRVSAYPETDEIPSAPLSPSILRKSTLICKI